MISRPKINWRRVAAFIFFQQTLVLILLIHGLTLSLATSSKSDDSYDFIVVGGGCSGSVVAGRLAESGIFKVLLLEAGGVAETDWDVPALAFKMFQNPTSPSIQIFQSVPQTNAALANNGTVYYMSGRAAGGSMSINGMQFNRGSPHDYAEWAKDGNWTYSKLLDYFKKSENYAGAFPSDQHGNRGPISVSSLNYDLGLNLWVQAGKELGYPTADPNGPQKISFAPSEANQRDGRRSTSYGGYIQPLLEPGKGMNLHVLLNTEATKIIFDGDKAVGIEYVTSSAGQKLLGIARASKEIVLSAGVLGSPILLMRSGIGPRSFLSAAQIPHVQYLEGVGKNLQNHAIVGVPIILNNKSNTFNPDEDLNPSSWKIYLESGTGPYASFGGLVGQAFLPSTESEDFADIQLVFFNTPAAASFVGGYQKVVESELKDGEKIVIIMTLVGRPQSRGTISLDEHNISNVPIIDFRLLTHENDMQIALAGMKATMKIMEAPTFKRFGARLPQTPLARCEHFKLYSDDYWKCFIQQLSFGAFHGCGTCKMSAQSEPDPLDVVDAELRVIGVRGLRIADASIIPRIPNANTQAAALAIGERAAEMIIMDAWVSSSLRRVKSIKSINI